MGQAATTANVPEILKSVWKDEIHDFHYEDCPTYAMIPKDTSWDGEYQIITVHYGGMAGRSAEFEQAKINKGPPKFKKMQISTRDNFAVWSVDHKLITLSRNQRGALVRALADSTEKAHTKIKRTTSQMLWRNGGGAVAKIASFSGAVATLSDRNDVRNLDLDDVCWFATDDGSATSPAGVKSVERYVVAIDEDAGTVTFDTTLVGSGVANADFIFHAGDYAKAFVGIPAYVPLSTPGSGGVPTSIWGMDRSSHQTRLGGHRFTASTANVLDEIKLALSKAFRRNIGVTHLFCGPEAFDEADTELGVSRRYVDEQIGRVGFKGIEFNMQGGKVVKLFSDADIPLSVNGKRLVYGLALDTWKFHTALEFPMWLTIDGKKQFMTEENANASEGRVGGYGQPYTTAPGENFVLELFS